MQDISTKVTLMPDSIIAICGIIVTVLIAVIGAVYKIVTDSRRYELTEAYRKELLQWYSEVSSLMIKVIHYCQCGRYCEDGFADVREDMLFRLSALMEVGRFYFPNSIEGDSSSHGVFKPAAYQGKRSYVLDLIVDFYYRAVEIDKGTQGETDYLWKLERHFTSFMFEMIQPRKRIREYERFLSIKSPAEQLAREYAMNHYIDDSVRDEILKLHAEGR